MPISRVNDKGLFDIIGDVHGCAAELEALLRKLGYQVTEIQGSTYRIVPPEGRKALFVGDLVDRGPSSPAVLRMVMGMVKAGTAMCVIGNHDFKLLRHLNGRQVQLRHGLEKTVAQLQQESTAFLREIRNFIASLPHHCILDEDRLLVAHAGLKESLQGLDSSAARAFCLYGDTTGQVDSYGLPVRINWGASYRGHRLVVYGHTPVADPCWQGNTVNIDTACVFGGALTALRYPEREIVSVSAFGKYAEPRRPVPDTM
jgi:protein phosphatase